MTLDVCGILVSRRLKSPQKLLFSLHSPPPLLTIPIISTTNGPSSIFVLLRQKNLPDRVVGNHVSIPRIPAKALSSQALRQPTLTDLGRETQVRFFYLPFSLFYCEKTFKRLWKSGPATVALRGPGATATRVYEMSWALLVSLLHGIQHVSTIFLAGKSNASTFSTLGPPCY